jgi:hypothetical protein
LHELIGLDLFRYQMAHQNQANVSLFSPWFNFGTSGAAFLPMPSPSLGDSINDTFVPWSENIFSSGLTPTPGQPMSQNYPILDMHPHMQGGGEDRTFIKQEAPFMPFAMPNMGGGDNKRQGPAADLRKESLASGPGSVSRVDSSSSGASAASMLIDGNARTPTPLFKSREPPRSFDSSGSYFTYPRPGGPEQMHSSYQHQPQLYSHQSEGSQQAVQPSQLFHQSQPSFQGHVPNHFMSFPPGLMQQNPSQHQTYMHQPDRQNSRESTSSEASSISPAMLNSRAPRTGSPVSMYSDDVLHSISAQTSPRSQVSLHLPGPNYNNTASGSAGQYTSGPGSLLKTHRDSTSSMQTDMSADGVDGVDVNADDDPDSMRKEKNGMIWGMDAPTYYKMSAVERKKLRNKLSARTHRVKRKRKSDL